MINMSLALNHLIYLFDNVSIKYFIRQNTLASVVVKYGFKKNPLINNIFSSRISELQKYFTAFPTHTL